MIHYYNILQINILYIRKKGESLSQIEINVVLNWIESKTVPRDSHQIAI